MPFGLSTAPEEFQQRLHDALESLPEVVCIADDTLVYGSGETLEEAEDHDNNLRGILCRAQDIGLRFNESLHTDSIELHIVDTCFPPKGVSQTPLRFGVACQCMQSRRSACVVVR